MPSRGARSSCRALHLLHGASDLQTEDDPHRADGGMLLFPDTGLFFLVPCDRHTATTLRPLKPDFWTRCLGGSVG